MNVRQMTLDEQPPQEENVSHKGMVTLAEAREYVDNGREEGVFCPCCKRFVKTYKRKLNSGMGVTLIRIYKHSLTWIHVIDFLREHNFHDSRDWTRLKHWGFLEESGDTPENGTKKSGLWKITPKGILFVTAQISCSKYIVLSEDELVNYDGEQISIIDALGSHFNYTELMNEIINL